MGSGKFARRAKAPALRRKTTGKDSISLFQTMGEFICQVASSVAKNPSLSLAARGFYNLMLALADYKTGDVPERFSPTDIEKLAGCSRRARLLLEEELTQAGLLRSEIEMITTRRGSYKGRKVYWVKTYAFFDGSKSEQSTELSQSAPAQQLTSRSSTAHFIDSRKTEPSNLSKITDLSSETTNHHPEDDRMEDDRIAHPVDNPALPRGKEQDPQKRQAWREETILGRAKTTPSNTQNYLRASLPKFLANEAEEIMAWLAQKGLELWASDPTMPWADVADELKQAAASRGLPYSPETIDEAIRRAHARRGPTLEGIEAAVQRLDADRRDSIFRATRAGHFGGPASIGAGPRGTPKPEALRRAQERS